MYRKVQYTVKDLPSDIETRKAMLNWVQYHPIWDWRKGLLEFEGCVHFEFVYVDPETETIEDNHSRNTAFRVWIEAGHPMDMSKHPFHCQSIPYDGWNEYNKWQYAQDLRLECGAPTAEEAILILALLVDYYYGPRGGHRKKPGTNLTWKK